jgi:hypothetical protein
MITSINRDIEQYSQQFEIINGLVGKTIKDIILYLEETDTDFSEQPNIYGKSLLSGFDIITEDQLFSIGNRYTNLHYGLTINIGRTKEFEFIEEDKKPVSIESKFKNQKIIKTEIYWMQIPFEGEKGYYPQEFELYTKNGFLLISSIEINEGKVNTEFTDELLLVDQIEIAKELKLGKFGLKDNGRKHFENIEKMKNGL